MFFIVYREFFLKKSWGIWEEMKKSWRLQQKERKRRRRRREPWERSHSHTSAQPDKFKSAHLQAAWWCKFLPHSRTNGICISLRAGCLCGASLTEALREDAHAAGSRTQPQQWWRSCKLLKGNMSTCLNLAALCWSNHLETRPSFFFWWWSRRPGQLSARPKKILDVSTHLHNSRILLEVLEFCALLFFNTRLRTCSQPHRPTLQRALPADICTSSDAFSRLKHHFSTLADT